MEIKLKIFVNVKTIHIFAAEKIEGFNLCSLRK
jgi:hypothetical protein